MFDFIEKSIKLDMTGLSSCLRQTWQELKLQLKNSPIVFLIYRQIPLLFETEVLEAIGNCLKPEFEDVTRNIFCPPPSLRTLFLVQLRQEDRKVAIWSHIVKRLVESKGRSKFIVPISQEILEELRRTSLYSLIKPYCAIFSDVSEDPSGLLAWLTGMQEPHPYKKRQLAELLFIAATSKIEEEWLSEEELSDIMSSLRYIEVAGQRKCYFAWHRWPQFEGLQSLYFRSIGLKPPYDAIAQLDQNFYLSACLSNFLESNQEHKLVEAATRVCADEAKEISNILKLRDRRETFPDLGKVISFLYRLGLVYTIAQETGPTQYMGITKAEFDGQPTFARELHWVGQEVFPLTDALNDALNKDDWKQTGGLIQQHIFSLASAGGVDFADTAQHIESRIREFINRVGDYSEFECKSLLLKTVKTIHLLHCSAALSAEALPKTLNDSFGELRSKCFERIPSSTMFSDSEWTNLKTKFEHLSKLSTGYKGAIRAMSTTQSRSRILDRIEKNKGTTDRIDDFFDLYATFLGEHDFFLDPKVAEKLGADIARTYIELDTNLQKGIPPFSDDFRDSKELDSLIASLPISEFDRIFVLIIDALSYLDWKLSSNEYADLNCLTTEEYRLSPVPTYTPCALTALITGYHPSLTGICDWKLITSSGKMIDLDPEAQSQSTELDEISSELARQNTLTLMHSHVGTPLTKIQKSLANLISIPLPSSEYQKAIAQASELIYKEKFETNVVAIYIADFDSFGHRYLTRNGFHEYYSVQARRIKNDLLLPIQKRAEEDKERTLVVLTADHGKLARYESNILSTVLPQTNAFQECSSLLSQYECRSHGRHILAWIPASDIQSLIQDLESKFAASNDILIFAGDTLKRFFPHESQTSFINPNLLIMPRFETGGANVAHGGGSLSEVVVPAIKFVFGGG